MIDDGGEAPKWRVECGVSPLVLQSVSSGDAGVSESEWSGCSKRASGRAMIITAACIEGSLIG